MSPSICTRRSVYGLLPLPPGTSLSWIPPSSLYCCHRSVSRISSAARKRRMLASPKLSVPLPADADDGRMSDSMPIAAGAAKPERSRERRVQDDRTFLFFLLHDVALLTLL